MLTSEGAEGDNGRSRELGIARHLVKPVKRSQLLAEITQAMGGVTSSAEPSPPPGSADAAEDQRALRILLVEDFPDNRMLVQSYLKNTPYRIDIAENGEIGVGKLKSGQYDLVLMDIAMPVMDGYTATREIRKWEEENGVRPTPVIALTASALIEDEQKCLDAGCTAYLTKPVKKRTLLGAIREHAAVVAAEA